MRKILVLALSIGMFSACDDLTELNVDTKSPVVVPPSSLVANSTVELFDYMSSTNVNENVFRLWSQQWAQVSYNDESNYELRERSIDRRVYTTFYANIIRDLREARTIIEKDVNLTAEQSMNQLAITNVLEAIAFTTVVDIFGDVPFTEAFDPANVTPAYDDDVIIYNAMITKLDQAIGNLGGDAGDIGDLVYGGSGDAWKTLANSYKLRLAIRLADSDNARAKDMAEEAIASGVFASNADNFTIGYEGSTPNTNPLWEDLVQSGRSDFVASNTLVDYMNALNDPRRATFFKQNVVDEGTGDVVYVGGIAGAVNSFTASSQVGAMLHEPTFPGTVMGYTEVLFLLADAAERGYATGGTAEEHYNAAVANSIMEWGGSQADADTYLAQADVAYATAPGTWKEKIALQKYLGLYNQGFEAWSTYRLYDAPAMNLADAAQIYPPSRFTYPVEEYSVNTSNVNDASSAIGGDMNTSKVFWDVN